MANLCEPAGRYSLGNLASESEGDFLILQDGPDIYSYRNATIGSSLVAQRAQGDNMPAEPRQ